MNNINSKSVDTANNPLLMAVFAQRIARFAAKDSAQLCELSTVTSVWQAAIVNFSEAWSAVEKQPYTLHRAAVVMNPEAFVELLKKEQVKQNLNLNRECTEPGFRSCSNPLHLAAPLHHAVYLGRKENVQALIDNGANVDQKTAFDNLAPFHFAAANGKIDMAQVLLANKANANQEDSYGMAPIHFAAAGGHKELVQVLLENGVSVDQKTKLDNAPIHFAAYMGHKEIVQVLLENGVSADQEDSYGMTPIHYAAANGKIDMARFLIANGANMELKDGCERTPSKVAAANGKIDMVRFFQEKRAQILADQEKASEYCVIQ